MALMKENKSNTSRIPWRIILGILLCFISILYIGVLSWGGVGIAMFAYFYDVPCIAIYALFCAGCVLLSGKKTKLDKLEFLQKIAIPNGALIAVIQFVFILANLDDVRALGPSVAVSLLVLVYSLVFYVVVTILKVRCEKEVLE